MAKFPNFIYEVLGTAVFIIVSSSAMKSTADGAEQALFFGLSWALCHVTFNDGNDDNDVQAYFNPVLTLAKFVASKSDLTVMIMRVIAQFIGTCIGMNLMASLNGTAVPSVVAEATFQEAIIMEVFYCALFAKLFLSHGKFESMPQAFYYAILIMMMTMVGGHSMNIARYTMEQMGGEGFPSSINVAYFVGGIVGPMLGALIHNWMD